MARPREPCEAVGADLTSAPSEAVILTGAPSEAVTADLTEAPIMSIM